MAAQPTYTLAEAIAELKRIGPVYDAAVRATMADFRYSAQPHARNHAERLAAAVDAADPTLKTSSVTSSKVSDGSWHPDYDWASIQGV